MLNCVLHICVCVGGGVVGGKCVKLCTAHLSVCAEGVVGGKCVKLCTAHLCVCVGGGEKWGESVLNCVLHI